MTMSKQEIGRALIELRLSGMAATLDTRVLQAQAPPCQYDLRHLPLSN